MAERIRLLIVDDIPETRDHLTRLLGFEDDIEVVGEAGTGTDALREAERLRPDVVLMDINMPDMDGIAVTERLATVVPTAAVIMMSVQGEADYLRRAMLAGAREFLVKPFSSDELVASIRQVQQREQQKRALYAPVSTPASGGGAEPQRVERRTGRIVSIVSPKGGVGRTTIAVNTAVAAAQRGKRVVLVDASFQFGDVGVLLNLNPKTRSIADLLNDGDALSEGEPIESYVVSHSSGIGVLLAPPSPEVAELITPTLIRKVLLALRERYDLVIVDAGAPLNEPTLSILDTSDSILAMLMLEITSIRDMRLFLDVAEQLGYADRIELVLNRADTSLGVRVADAESSIGRRMSHTIVSDGKSVVSALNRGIPFVITNPETAVSQDVRRLAAALSGETIEPAEAPAPEKKRQGQRRRIFAWR